MCLFVLLSLQQKRLSKAGEGRKGLLGLQFEGAQSVVTAGGGAGGGGSGGGAGSAGGGGGGGAGGGESNRVL